MFEYVAFENLTRNQSVGELVVLITTNSSTLWSDSNYSIVRFAMKSQMDNVARKYAWFVFFSLIFVICIIRRSIHVLRSNLKVQRKRISGSLCRVLTCMPVLSLFFYDRIYIMVIAFLHYYERYFVFFLCCFLFLLVLFLFEFDLFYNCLKNIPSFLWKKNFKRIVVR